MSIYIRELIYEAIKKELDVEIDQAEKAASNSEWLKGYKGGINRSKQILKKWVIGDEKEDD